MQWCWLRDHDGLKTDNSGQVYIPVSGANDELVTPVKNVTGLFQIQVPCCRLRVFCPHSLWYDETGDQIW